MSDLGNHVEESEQANAGLSSTSIADEIDRVLQHPTRRNWSEAYREGVKRKLKHIGNDAERAVDYCRVLMRSGEDVTDELNELEIAASALMLVTMLLKREAGK